MSDLLSRIKVARTKVESLRQRKAGLEGQKEQLLNQLRLKHECTSLEDAAEKLEQLEVDIAAHEAQLEEAVLTIEKKVADSGL